MFDNLNSGVSYFMTSGWVTDAYHKPVPGVRYVLPQHERDRKIVDFCAVKPRTLMEIKEFGFNYKDLKRLIDNLQIFEIRQENKWFKRLVVLPQRFALDENGHADYSIDIVGGSPFLDFVLSSYKNLYSSSYFKLVKIFYVKNQVKLNQNFDEFFQETLVGLSELYKNGKIKVFKKIHFWDALKVEERNRVI